MPLNRRYPIAEVLDAAREYADAKGRRVTFEYACIEGVNDHPHQADALAGRLRGFRGGAHVNLIPLNPTGGFGGPRPGAERIAQLRGRACANAASRSRSGAIAASTSTPRAANSGPGAARAVPGSSPIGHNGRVNEYRWFNPSQPQTLQTGVLLCYLNAVFGLLFGVPSSVGS